MNTPTPRPLPDGVWGVHESVLVASIVEAGIVMFAVAVILAVLAHATYPHVYSDTQTERNE